MKLEVGMYVRTKKGSIGKILGIDYRIDGKGNDLENIEGLYFDNCIDDIGKDIFSLCFYIFKDAKADHDITKLIEVGDLVNGYLIRNITDMVNQNIKAFELFRINGTSRIAMWGKEDIKNVVTKEQFESMSYKVGE